MDVQKVGEFIKKKRKDKDMTQKELADKLNITDRAISKWERGICCPDISLLKELCNILEVSINELLSGEEIETLERDKTEDVLIETVKQYTSVEKKKTRKLAFFTIILLVFYVGLVFAMYLTYNQVNKNDKLNWNTYGNKKVLDKFLTAIENYDYKILREIEMSAYTTGITFIGDVPFEDETKCEEYKEQRKSGERLSGPGRICMLKYFEENGLNFISHEYLYQLYVNGSGEWATKYQVVAEYNGTKVYISIGGFVRNGVIAEMFAGLDPKQEDQFFSLKYPDITDKLYTFFGMDSEWKE